MHLTVSAVVTPHQAQVLDTYKNGSIKTHIKLRLNSSFSKTNRDFKIMWHLDDRALKTSKKLGNFTLKPRKSGTGLQEAKRLKFIWKRG